jgi:hypothetical protein
VYYSAIAPLKYTPQLEEHTSHVALNEAWPATHLIAPASKVKITIKSTCVLIDPGGISKANVDRSPKKESGL